MMSGSIVESPAKKMMRKAGLVLYLLYIGALVYFLFFADWYDHAPGMQWEHRVNVMPFLEIRRSCRLIFERHVEGASLNLFGNVVGFLPVGFLPPVITRTMRKFHRVLLHGLFVSLIVELIQLITRAGRCDVDDVILNTTGCALGYLIFLIVDHVRIRAMSMRKP